MADPASAVAATGCLARLYGCFQQLCCGGGGEADGPDGGPAANIECNCREICTRCLANFNCMCCGNGSIQQTVTTHEHIGDQPQRVADKTGKAAAEVLAGSDSE
ncbi:MAG: hypothetical protein S4CHLAM37_07000 [Chlamydiia bacterium]|nr:hypothetical protein [Chlamydiia bacterium]